MMRVALLFPVLLAACVGSEIPDSERVDGVLAGTPIEVDGLTLVAEQMTDWPVMQAQMDANGNSILVQAGTGDTVVISGSPDSRDRAIEALAQFCGRMIDPAGFDSQYVYQEPSSGDWWFDGFRCEG
jgi:hypothetical protein